MLTKFVMPEDWVAFIGGGGRDKIKISRAGGLGVRNASNCDGGGGGCDEMSRAGGVGCVHRDCGGGFIFLHF